MASAGPIIFEMLRKRGEQQAREDLAAYLDVRRPQPAVCTIYFAGPVGGPIKIGWASRLAFRIKDLRNANAYPLEVWATVEGPPSLERDYHRRFKAHRQHGEWFTRAPEILAEIARLSGKEA